MSNLGTFTRNRISSGEVKLTLPNVGAGGGTGVNAQYNIFQNRFYGGGNVFQYKTNIPFSGWSMHNIEAVGYNYGTSQPIRCNWCFHVSYGNGFYNQDYSQIYNGLYPTRSYNSSDGYVVIVGQAGSSYFAGWSFNAYSINPTGPFDVNMLASVQLTSDYNYY